MMDEWISGGVVWQWRLHCEYSIADGGGGSAVGDLRWMVKMVVRLRGSRWGMHL